MPGTDEFAERTAAERTAAERTAARWRDRSDLRELMSRFATGIDTCDWSMYRSVFDDEIELDYSSWRAEHLGSRDADEWVDRARRLFPGLTATRHALTNVLVTFTDGTEAAQVRSNVCADHVLTDGTRTDVFTLNGYYDDRCIRTASGWKIRGKRLVVQWSTGDPAVLERAAARVRAQAHDLREAD